MLFKLENWSCRAQWEKVFFREPISEREIVKKKYLEIRDIFLYIDPAMDHLVHPDTVSVDMPYLGIKNYGALYTKPDTDDPVHPNTTFVNTPFLGFKNYGALYGEPVAPDLVYPDTTPINIQ